MAFGIAGLVARSTLKPSTRTPWTTTSVATGASAPAATNAMLG